MIKVPQSLGDLDFELSVGIPLGFHYASPHVSMAHRRDKRKTAPLMRILSGNTVADLPTRTHKWRAQRVKWAKRGQHLPVFRYMNTMYKIYTINYLPPPHVSHHLLSFGWPHAC